MQRSHLINGEIKTEGERMGIKAKQKENTEGVKTEENVELTATLSVFIQKCRSKRFTHYR